MIPKDYRRSSSAPTSNLTLSFVHGYRGFDCRNNVFYNDVDASTISFHSAGASIVQSASEDRREQVHFTEHSDDIISNAVHYYPDSTIMATGELGKIPVIHLVKYTLPSPSEIGNKSVGMLESLAMLSGYHQHGVCQLAFSKDGTKLFSVGLEYSVAVYCSDITPQNALFGKLLASMQGPKENIMHCCSFGLSGDSTCFLSCGEKHVLLWKMANKGSSLTSESVKLGDQKRQTFLSAADLLDDSGVVATLEGDLFLIQGLSLVATALGSFLKAHKKAINTLWVTKDGKSLLSGGAEGMVIIWKYESKKLMKSRSINIFDFCSIKLSPIRALCTSPDNRKLLLGTQSCDIIEFTSTASLFLDANHNSSFQAESFHLQAGHFKDEVWGLATCASTQEFCTVGDDATLRIYSLASSTQVALYELGASAKCVAYSPDGTIISVGFGSGVVHNKRNSSSGTVRNYSFAAGKFSLLLEIKDAKRDINDIKFSPDGKYLAVGSADNSIYIYNVLSEYRKKIKFSKHNAAISHFDFSSDSKYLRSNCNAYELLFCEVATGKLLKAEAFIGTEWNSCTCTLQAATLGIWSAGMDGTDVNAVARSPTLDLLATGDDFSKVKLFRYPCIAEHSSSIEVKGHSSHVTNVRWITSSSLSTTSSEENKTMHLITTGGNDKTVMVWICSMETSLSSSSSESSSIVSKAQPRKGETPEEVTVFRERKELSDITSVFTEVTPGGGDEFTAIKPWLGAIFPPKAYSTETSTSMDALDLEIQSLHLRYQTKFMALTSTPKKEYLQEKDMSPIYSELKAMTSSLFQKSQLRCAVDPYPPATTDEFELEWVKLR